MNSFVKVGGSFQPQTLYFPLRGACGRPVLWFSKAFDIIRRKKIYVSEIPLWASKQIQIFFYYKCDYAEDWAITLPVFFQIIFCIDKTLFYVFCHINTLKTVGSVAEFSVSSANKKYDFNLLSKPNITQRSTWYISKLWWFNSGDTLSKHPHSTIQLHIEPCRSCNSP